MKKSHRILLCALALVLCLALTVGALAEGVLGTLYRTATALLFDTENVTLNAHATFTLDGELFKTLDGTCVQDDSNSKLQLMLKTPKADGSIYEGGYTVIANAGRAYSIETAMPQVYNTYNCSTSNSLLSTTALRRAIVELGGAIVEVCEGAFADKITTTADAVGTQYHIALAEGQAPRLVNAAGTLLAQAVARRFFYIDPDLYTPQYSEGVRGCDVEFEDYDASFAAAYKEKFGEEFPEDFYEQLWGEDGSMNKELYDRYDAVTKQIYELQQQAQDEYENGVAMICADGSVKHYETRDAYMIDNDLQSVVFEDYDALFLKYYKEKTGNELTALELQAIQMSENWELSDAYYEMSGELFDQQYEHYMQILVEDGQHAMLQVKADGSYRLIDNVDSYWRNEGNNNTPTIQVLSTMEKVTLGDTDVTVETDTEGRFAAGSGKVCLLVEDCAGAVRRLEVEFELSAGDYGTSQVEQFDPEALHVMDWGEYIEALDRGEVVLPSQPDWPETVVFNGVEYDIVLESSDNG